MPRTVVVALGSNLGPRRYNVLRAIHELSAVLSVVRVSAIRETAPVAAPAGSPPFLNAVVIGHTRLSPEELLSGLLAIERRLGRVRRGVVNEPRAIDLDLILYGGHRIATASLTVPHPRAAERSFVMEPLRELGWGGWMSAGSPADDAAARSVRGRGSAFVRQRWQSLGQPAQPAVPASRP